MTTTKRPSLRFMGGSALLLVLVAGGLSGAAIDRAVSSRQPTAREQDECARFRQDRTRRTRRPYSHLELSAEQRQQMEAVLEKRKIQTDEFWAENQPRWNAIVEGARAELKAILTPEQQAEDDRRMERRRADWQALERRCTEKLQEEQTNTEERPNQPTQGSQDRPSGSERPSMQGYTV